MQSTNSFLNDSPHVNVRSLDQYLDTVRVIITSPMSNFSRSTPRCFEQSTVGI
jgi:hypothetical protein